MLASLLPGLRDVRTPLTVGYLWLLTGWIWFSSDIPTKKPPGDGFVSRLFNLRDILGNGPSLAAFSFLAYVLGALLTIPLEGGLLVKALNGIPSVSSDVRTTRYQYEAVSESLAEEVDHLISGATSGVDAAIPRDIFFAKRSDVGDLRPRLLVSNQELYGEYDRLASEAAFRLNLCAPLAAIGVTAGHEVWVG